jgi:3-keto-5-aminohexanoate cleavage enzyme
VHLHVRWDDGTPTQDRARFQECEEAILKECPNVILIPSTGGAVGMTPDERLQSTDTIPLPEMATLDCGTCNFGDDIFDNTMPTMRAFGKRMIEKGIKPEYECFEMGHLDTILTMARKGEVPGNPMQFNFVLGVPGCTPATVDNLCWLVNTIPAGSTWTATGIGRYAFQLAAPAIVMGGNVRVGFEDNLYLERGVLAKSNGELVDKVVRMAKLLGRPVATSDEAREILGLKR